MKGYRIREEMNGVEEPPGKVWFWELEAGVIEADRCIQCGTCVAVCPSNSIGIDEDTLLPELVKMCTGCSLCWDFCPRGGLRYEALWPPSTALPGQRGDERPARPRRRRRDGGAAPTVMRTDSSDTYWKITGGPPADGLGAVLGAYAVRAGGRPEGAQDGGVVSALLIAALAGGEIDGALVTRQSDDPDEPWKGVAHIATTAKEITEAAGSYYNQTMALAELDLSRYDLPATPRIAVVGTPCEIQGIRAMQSRRWPSGRHRIDAVVLTIALLCTKSFDYRGLILQLLREDRGIEIERVSKVDVIRGRMIVEYRDGEVAVDEPVKNFHGAALKGCDECADFLGRVPTCRSGASGRWTGGAACWCGPSEAGEPWTTPVDGSTSVSSTTSPRSRSSTPSTSGSPSTAFAGPSTRTPRCSSTTPITWPPTRDPTAHRWFRTDEAPARQPVRAQTRVSRLFRRAISIGLTP